jgi:transcriptional regulator with XRE-family HTH domain
MQHVGKKIKSVISEKKFSAKDVAMQLGVSYQHLYRIFASESVESRYLESLSEILKVPVSVFFGFSIEDENKVEFEILRQEIIQYSKQVKEYQNTLKRNTLNEQLVLEMYRYFEESLSVEEKKILSTNKKYEKFTMYLVSCFGMNIWDEEGNEKMMNANKKLFDLASNSDTVNSTE